LLAPAATPANDTADYELGVALAAGLSRSASPAVQTVQLQKARGRLEKFLEEHPRQIPLTFAAKTRLAEVLTGLGKLDTEMVAAAEESPPQRARLLDEARGCFQTAQQTWEALEKELQDERANNPPIVDDKDPRSPRCKELDRELLKLPLEIGAALDGRAKTYRPADKEYRELLTVAAARYHRLYAKHSAFYGGIYARMCEGRTLAELGRTSEAIETFQDVWPQVCDGEPLRPIRDRTLVLMLKTCSLPAVKRYQEALRLAADWQTKADPAEQSSPEGLEVHYLAGLATASHARTLAEDSAARRQAMLDAKSHFDFVIAHCGELQGQAWERSAELATVLPPAGDDKPASFVQSKAAGDAAWEHTIAWRVQAQDAKTWQDHERYASAADQAARRAIACYRRALATWPPPAPLRSPEQQAHYLNLVRYRLAYLSFAAGEYYDAGLLGEFLAQHYPEAAEARKAAEISVEAYRNVVIQRLRSAAAAAGDEPLSTEAIRRATDLATERLVHVGRLLIGHWPEEDEAVEAARLLIDTAIDRRDAASAEDFLAAVPAASSYRPQAELRVGQAWWETYVEAAPIAGEDRLPPGDLRKVAERAQTMLRQGIEHSQAGLRETAVPEYALVYSAFALAQMAMDQGRAAEAVRWLDDAAVGPMTLVSSARPVSGDLLAMIDQTLLLAVFSYASARTPDKALDTLDRLENRALGGGDPLASRQLSRQYNLAGRRLGKVLVRLKQEGKADEVQQIAIGQELLLERIARRKEAPSFAMQLWVVETCLALGDGQGPLEASEASTCLQRAVRTCLAILDRLQESPSWGPPDAASDIQVRLAAGLRAQGQYRQALDRLAAVLFSKNLRIDAQIEAARTWQAWGHEEPDGDLRAIRGDSWLCRLPGGAGRQVHLWGWEEIARQLSSVERYREQFLEASYNLAFCRTKWAATQTGKSRGEMLDKAAAEVAAVRARPPSAGSEWAARFDSLLSEIEKVRTVKVSGRGF
jgi:hypothetical protein